MPYRKSYKRRKFKRRANGGWMNLARKAFRYAKYVRSLLNVEKKFHDVTTSSAVDSAGVITDISSIAQGDTGETRDGDQVKLVSLQVRASGSVNASATATTCRTIIFIDKEQDGTAPTVAEVLESASELANLNLDNRRRFIVLFDKVNTVNVSAIRNFHWERFKKLSIKLNWSDGTGTNHRHNALFMLRISSEATNTPSMSVETRLRFIDN